MSNPYKELASYEENDAKIFKGRSTEIQEMYENFSNNEYMVCYADSGEGKSSIIEAGLIPILRSNFYYPIHIVFKDKEFKDNNMDFNEFVCQKISDEVDKLKEDTTIRVDMIYPKRLSNDKSSEVAEWEKQMIDSYVWLKLRYVQLTIDNFVFIPVLIFDQFEEVFTNPQSQEWTDSFFAWLQELTMDLCPKVIVNDLENKLGTEKFPQIATQKHFKAIFSLRSEYIGQLDYWGMQKHYIPQLKNNRYLLRPLTIAGAKEVITQQEDFAGLNDVADVIVDILRNLQKGKNSVFSKDSELPCIPALFLSVVCSQAYSLPKQEQMDFIRNLKEKGKEVVENLIGQFYEKAVSECQIPDKDLEVVEEMLVNNAGIRQRISSQSDELRKIDFSGNYKEKLKNARLIRVIPEYNRPEESIELIHDCLCNVIKERKKVRNYEREQLKLEEAAIKEELKKKVAEETKRREEQREDITSSLFLLVLLSFIIWFLSTVYCDLEIAKSIGAFDTNVILSLGNFAVLPFIIYGTIKRLKITSWISVYGLISNIALMYIFLVGQDKEMTLRTLYATVVVGVPAITLIYSFRYNLFGAPPKTEYTKLLKSIPLLSFFAVISAYMFYLCVFNTALGLPEPFNSFWGVVVVPLLCHEIIRNGFRMRQRWANFFVLCVFLFFLAYNTFNTHFSFSSVILSALIVGTLMSMIWLFRKLSRVKMTIAIAADFIVVILVLLLNLGFNPIIIKYDNVDHVYNWLDVSIKDHDGKIGVVTAITGETIVPCLLDTIDYRHHYFHVLSSKLHYEEDLADSRELYTYKKDTGISHYKGSFFHHVELDICKYANKSEIASTFQDSLKVYAARSYREVRNANLTFLLSGKMYSTQQIKSLDTLIALQDKEMANVLGTLDSMSSENKTFNDSLVVFFYKAFARTFYLCMLKDRVQNRDSVNLFTMAQEFVLLYFYDVPNYELRTSVIQPMTIGDYHKVYKSSYMVSDLRINTLDSWYNYINMLLGEDASINFTSWAKNITAQLDTLKKKSEKLTKDINKMRNDHSNRMAASSSMKGIEKIRYLIDSLKKNDEDISSKELEINSLMDQVEGEKLEMDLSFRKLINDVFATLTSVVVNCRTIYNSAFIDLCEQLYLSSRLRRYEISSTYRECIESMNSAEHAGYNAIKEFDNAERELKKELNM